MVFARIFGCAACAGLSRTQTKTVRIAYSRAASQAAGAAPTLRYGPAGDRAPRLRLKASGMAERFPFGPSTRLECLTTRPMGRGAMLPNRYQMRYSENMKLSPATDRS